MEKLIDRLRQSVTVPAFLVLSLWAIHGFLFVLHIDAGSYGLTPRSAEGLFGILTSPFVHANLTHLFSNSFPLFVLATGIIYFYRQTAVQAILLIYFLTQVFVWTFARGEAIGYDGLPHPVTHLGISGVVYGLFAFVLGMGVFQRNIKSIILGLLAVTYYGSMIWGVLPFQTGVSWESHLFGAIVGFLVAFAFRDVVEPDDDLTQGNAEAFRINRRVSVDKSNRPFFLPRYSFDGLREKYNAPPPPPEESFNPFETHLGDLGDPEAANPSIEPINEVKKEVTQQIYDEWLVLREKRRLKEETSTNTPPPPPNLEQHKDEAKPPQPTENTENIQNIENTGYTGYIKKTEENKPMNNGWYTTNTWNT